MGFFTVGHSSRTCEDFLDLLREQRIERIVDVRTYPRSRRYPHFNAEILPEYLQRSGIGYVPMGSLGGFRKPRNDSRNLGLRSTGFRGFADFMETTEFARNMEMLLNQGRSRRVAIMCAEAVYWACHRFLISDALVQRGRSVLHILDRGKTEKHLLTGFAVVEAGRLVYPPAQKGLFPA